MSPRFGPAFGNGPAYPVGGPAIADFPLAPSTMEDGLFPIKILWVAPPTFTGYILVRGISADSGSPLRFSASQQPELRIDWTGDSSGDWRESATYTWVRGPGCHQWQVDTESSSDVLVFTARLDT